MVAPPMRDSVKTQNIAVLCLDHVLLTCVAPVRDDFSLRRERTKDSVLQSSEITDTGEDKRDDI